MCNMLHFKNTVFALCFFKFLKSDLQERVQLNVDFVDSVTRLQKVNEVNEYCGNQVGQGKATGKLLCSAVVKTV